MIRLVTIYNVPSESLVLLRSSCGEFIIRLHATKAIDGLPAAPQRGATRRPRPRGAVAKCLLRHASQSCSVQRGQSQECVTGD